MALGLGQYLKDGKGRIKVAFSLEIALFERRLHYLPTSIFYILLIRES
jgi:hypothetical protein